MKRFAEFLDAVSVALSFLWVVLVVLLGAYLAVSFVAIKLKKHRNTSDRVRTANIERDRLAVLLSRYDRCRCGKLRWQHDDQWVACKHFTVTQPADDLETVVNGDTLAGRDRLRKAVEERRKRLKAVA